MGNIFGIEAEGLVELDMDSLLDEFDMSLQEHLEMLSWEKDEQIDYLKITREVSG